MPFFRIDGTLHYFAHVPKCAGTSVEAYLRGRFGTLAFVNSSFYKVPEHARWTRSSPQHVDVAALSLLVPDDWIASCFAVVRHPVSRLRSAFDYQLTGEKTVSSGMDINDWFLAWDQSRADAPFQYDNHPRPASDLVPEGSTVFRMEDGLQGIVAHLDDLAGSAGGARDIPHENKSRGGASYPEVQAPLNADVMARISAIYANDFKRFGYDCADVIKDTKPKAALPRQKTSILNWFLRR